MKLISTTLTALSRRSTLTSLAASLLLISSTPALAGPDADALGHCLVTSSTSADKMALVTWMFTSMAQHPAVAEMSNVSEEERRDSLQAMANLMTVLLTDRCGELARTAIRNEGPIAMQTSFATLGQVAATELFAHPAVSTGLAELDSFLDHEAINEALELRGPGQ
jgi:hypothetical protein